MPMKVCEVCAKEFEVAHIKSYNYRLKYKMTHKFYCSYSCYRKNICVNCGRPALAEFSFIKNEANAKTEWKSCSLGCYQKLRRRFK